MRKFGRHKFGKGKTLDTSRYATFSRRNLITCGTVGGIFCILGGRLYQLQIREGDEFMMAAEDNRISLRLIAPPRSRILDRFGVPLAANRRNYRVMVIAEQATEGVGKAIKAIARVIALTPRQQEKALRDIHQNRNFVPVPVAENLSWEEYSRINLHLPYLPGVQPDVGETRDYPYGKEMSHMLGYVGSVNVKEKKADDDPLLSLPGFRVGKRGIEKQFDAKMRGSAGASRVEVNAYGRVVRELSYTAGKPGGDVYLTIDQKLQHFVEQQLGDNSAACVVMDVMTGDVLAFCSTPGYDPNAFNVGITGPEWRALLHDDHKPLVDKVISGSYPPGSTFKPVVALAAIDAGLKDFTTNCSGVLMLGSHAFHCWKRGGHGHVDIRNGIMWSCDIFFYELARKLGIDKIEAAARKLGLGAQTGIDLPGENGGFIPSRAWKRERFHRPWQMGETMINAIGQGYVLATPLQICMMASRIASGRVVSPRLTHSIGGEILPHAPVTELGFSQEALDLVRSGLYGVSNEAGGSAYPWRITYPGLEMAGKTGTAQVRRITTEERKSGVRSNASLPWKLRDHAWFFAFAPFDKPRYACAVLIEHGATYAHYQVQMVRNILTYAQKRDPLALQTAYPVDSARLDMGGRML